MPAGPGEALDLGCGAGSYLGLIAARRGYRTAAIDLLAVEWPYVHPRLGFRQGDIFDLGLTPSSLDLIINCSAVEHVGLRGSYDGEDRPEGDIEAMALMRDWIKPGGLMLLTIPVGRDTVYARLHRIYGRERLPRLLNGFRVEKKEYWLKDERNRWLLVDEAPALALESRPWYYGLGLYVCTRAPVPSVEQRRFPAVNL